MLLGSVTAKVLHDTPCPVWTSSHTEHATQARYPYRTVACALELSERSEDTIRWAYQFASQQNARLQVVHAIDVDEESTNRGVLEEHPSGGHPKDHRYRLHKLRSHLIRTARQGIRAFGCESRRFCSSGLVDWPSILR